MRYFVFIILFTIAYIVNVIAFANPVITQKPILFDAKRIELTKEYRKQHYGIDQKSIVIVPKMIVLHWTESDTLQRSFEQFYLPSLKFRPEISAEGKLNTSAQFLVDKNGSIYQLMPSNWMARHIIGLNNVAIGIENVGGSNRRQNLTQQQIDANVALIHYLVKKYPTIHYLIGHFEYGRFRNSPSWLEKNPNYFTPKEDPGPLFMQAVRERVGDLNLKSHP